MLNFISIWKVGWQASAQFFFSSTSRANIHTSRTMCACVWVQVGFCFQTVETGNFEFNDLLASCSNRPNAVLQKRMLVIQVHRRCIELARHGHSTTAAPFEIGNAVAICIKLILKSVRALFKNWVQALVLANDGAFGLLYACWNGGTNEQKKSLFFIGFSLSVCFCYCGYRFLLFSFPVFSSIKSSYLITYWAFFAQFLCSIRIRAKKNKNNRVIASETGKNSFVWKAQDFQKRTFLHWNQC